MAVRHTYIHMYIRVEILQVGGRMNVASMRVTYLQKMTIVHRCLLKILQTGGDQEISIAARVDLLNRNFCRCNRLLHVVVTLSLLLSFQSYFFIFCSIHHHLFTFIVIIYYIFYYVYHVTILFFILFIIVTIVGWARNHFLSK